MKSSGGRILVDTNDSDAFDPDTGMYVFHHMPKCGGTALRQVLEKWFHLKGDYISDQELYGHEPVKPPLDLQALGKNRCLCGHFEWYHNHLGVRYPEVISNRRRYFLFSFVREPLELAMSLYFFGVKVGWLNPQTQGLQQWLETHCNYMAARFPCTSENYKEILERYNFIGLQEEMSSSMEKLATIVGREPFSVPEVNVSPRDQQETSLSEEAIARFKARNELDYAIYDYVRAKFFG
jgi:hypothetical protein